MAYDVRRKEWFDTTASMIRHFVGSWPFVPTTALSRPYNFGLIICLTLFFLVSVLIPPGRTATPGGALDPPSGQPAGAPAHGQGNPAKMSLEEIAKELNNPVTKLWFLDMKYETFFLKGRPSHSYRAVNSFTLQPVMSFPLGENWKLITRPIVQFLSLPYIRSVRANPATRSLTLNWDRTSGLGDFRFLSLLSPNTERKFVWGLGPTWIFSTAPTHALGAGKYQMGPAAVAAYLGDKWILGALLQQWWSIAGDRDRPNTNQMELQYFIQYRLPGLWQVGMTPIIQVNWYANSKNAVSLPIGFGINKTFKIGRLPMRVGPEFQWYVERPHDFGPRYSIKIFCTPVIPSPFAWKELMAKQKASEEKEK
jgi:hypothetical protein